MRRKGGLILAIVQLVIGLLAAGSFVLLVAVGETDLIGKWTIAFLCAMIAVVGGICGIIAHKSK